MPGERHRCGREAHTEGGKYAIYPTGDFEACMIPFVDGAFKLDGKTKSAGAVMTSYTIAYDEDMQYGELVGSGFSKYKVAELLRDKFGFADAALAAQVKCIVMLKNAGGVIKKTDGSAKPKVYVPMRYTAAYRTSGTMDTAPWKDNSATCELPLSSGTLEKYFDVVTDKLADTLTGPADEKTGNATPAEADLTRLAAADIVDCDMVLVCAKALNNASSRAAKTEEGTSVPLSVQYRPYTADGDVVRKASLAGDPADGSSWAEHETAKGVAMENRSYFGQTSMITNEAQLDQILDAAALAKEAGKPCVVILDITQPMCVHEFESEVDAILVSMSGSTEAACRIVAGQDEPSGLLPMQFPLDMDAVERQSEDASRDMDCYVDADGNTYDFCFGLNWAGVIEDERVKTYKVVPLTKPEDKLLALKPLHVAPGRLTADLQMACYLVEKRSLIYRNCQSQ